MDKSKNMKWKRNDVRVINVNLGTIIVLSVPVFFLIFAGLGLLRQPSLNSNKIVESSTDISILQKMKPIVVKATKHDLQGDTGDLKNSNWFATIQKEMSKSEYFIREDAASGNLGSPNRKNNLRFTYDADGFSVKPRTTKIPLEELKPGQDPEAIKYKTIKDWAIRFDLNNNQWGKGYWKIAHNKAEYVTDKVTVQYDNQEEGMRQNFVVQAPLEKGKKLAIGFKVSTTLKVTTNKEALDFNLKGEQVMQYKDLKVWDANGKTLNATLQYKGKDAYSIEVDDSKAVYPITIDPISTTAAAMVESNQASASMGISVAGAGDVNGDGFSDVIVGANTYDNGQTDEGAAFIYHGSAAGISTTAAARVESNNAAAQMGISVSGAGDVNGDGYSDVIVAARLYSNGQTNEGAAFVYYGSSIGISSTAAWVVESNQAGAQMGSSVSGGGDVNGDGYSDVVVGAFQYTNGQTNEGVVYVYHGSATGISTTATSMVESNQASAGFGLAVSGAGDLNGDGFSDVIVGAYAYDDGQNNEGAAFVYHGGATGISTTAAARVESNQVNAWFGYTVSGAGDVNGDGYSDIIVGAIFYDNGQTDEGAAFVYHGSTTGISLTAAASVESNQASASLGIFVSGGGDVNGDGFSDVIVGAVGYDNGETDEGAAFIYQGSATGISTTATAMVESNQASASMGVSVSGAGDVNGDGYSDVIVGANGYDNGETDEGAAFIYHGSATGISTTASAIVDSNQYQSIMGKSVSGGGDVNGDGYSDVIVGANRYDNGQTDEGAVFVFYGSSIGINLTAAWVVESNQVGAQMGSSVSGGVDLNGDGYSDVIVGAPLYDNGQTDEGAAFVYHGSGTGISTTAAAMVESNQESADMGWSVSGAGDVNGDGYSDVIVGARRYDNGETSEGSAFVYHGSSIGISTTAAAMVESNQLSALMGVSVACAGDVNGDGFSDVIVGANGYENGQTNEGAAFIYHGSATGISTTPATSLESNNSIAQMGYSVSGAGDVNGDGYSDVIVGAPYYRNGNSDEGAAFIYHGSASGIITTVAAMVESNKGFAYMGHSVSGAGDVNGDGYSDLIVGVRGYSNGQSNEGAFFVYHGSFTGISTTAAAIVESNQLGAGMGHSVSGAGDVNGDGYSDVIVGVTSYDNGQTDEGAAFVYLGNGGGSHAAANNILAYNADASTRINQTNANQSSFGAGLFAKSFQGRTKGKLVWEVVGNGSPFSGGSAISNSVSNTNQQSSFTNLGLAGVSLANTISKTSSKSNKIRVRVKYDLVSSLNGQVYGPWRYLYATNDLQAIIALPTTAIAGDDQTSSATCGLTQVTLAGNTPTVGTGAWSIVSGTGGSFADASSPISAFTGTAGATYTLRWTISNSPSTPSTDDVVIKFNLNPGNFGNALKFDGVNNYVTKSASAINFSTNNEFTAEALVKFVPSGWDFWLTMRDVTAIKYRFGTDASGKLYWDMGQHADRQYAGFTFTSDSWYHVAFTAKSNGTEIITSIYINGNLITTFNEGISTLPSVSTLNIGSGETGAHYFNGTIDEMRIWNVARTASQIQASMNAELAGSETGLVAYYNFNQGVAGGNNTGITTLNDLTGNGYNGTLTNMTLTGTTSNWVTGNSFSIAAITGTSSVCSNGTSQMSNAILGGVWSLPNSTYATVNTTGLLSGVAAGSPTLSYSLTSGAGCTSAATQVITINALPTPTISAGGATTFCNGGSVLLTAGNATGNVRSGNALTFTKTSSRYVSVPHSASLNLSAFTMEAWVNYSGENITILDKGNYNFLWSLNANNNGNKMGFYNNSNFLWNYSTAAVAQNTWTHVAITLSGGTLTFYINGVASGTASVGSSTADNIEMNIGRQQPSSCKCNHFNGTMDELRIWNVARSQSDILANYESTVPTNSSNLVAYYKFDESTGTTTADASSNGNNGTLVNGPTRQVPSTSPVLLHNDFIWYNDAANVGTTQSITATTAGSYTVKVTLPNGCSATSGATSVAVSALPTAAAAGDDQTGSTTCGRTKVPLASNTPTVGTGGWSIVSGTGGSFDDDSSPTSIFNGTAGSSYTLRWTISNSPCIASTDDVVITFNKNPTTANAGADQNVVSSGGILSAALAGNEPIVGTGLWTIVSGSGGTITTPSSPTSTFTGTAGVTYTLRWTISNSPCNSSSDDVHISSGNVWTGNTSNLWNVAGNWSLGTVPTSSDIVIINTITPNAPQLNVDFTIGSSLTISGTGTLTVNAGKTLSIAAGGTADFGGKLVTFKSDATGSAQFGQMLGSLSNANNVTVERYIPASNRAFRLISSPVTTTSSIKYNWMENATLGVNSYPYVGGTPQNPNAGYGTHITGSGGNTNGFDQTGSNNPSLFTHDNSGAGAWNAVTSTTTGTLAAGDAYRIQIRGDRGYAIFASPLPAQSATTLRTNGTLYTGNKTVNLNTTANGFSMIGNPYQATVDMYAAGITKNNITDYYYIWDPRMGTRGAYVSYGGSVTRISSNVASAVNQYLQPGQAIFVQTSNTGGAASIEFGESAKSIASNQSLVFSRFKGNAGMEFGFEPNAPQTTYTSLNTTLYYTDSLATGAMPMDGLKVMFDNTFNNVVDQVDARKMYNLDETMSVLRDGTNLSIELMNRPDSTTVIPLNITNYRTQKYTFRMRWTNPYTGINNKVTAFLKDKYTGMQYEVNNILTTDIPYTIDAAIPASYAANRFDIVFMPTAMVALPIAEIALTAAVQQNGIKLQWTNPYDKDLSKYEVERSADGRVFTKLNTQAAGNGIQKNIIYNWFDATPIEGYNYYRIKGLALNNGKTQWSNNLKIRSWTLNIGTTIAPNPAERTGLNVKTDLPKGYYDMKLIDSRGRVVYTKGVEYNGLGGAIELRYGVALAAGTYYLHIEGMGERVVRGVIVQ